MSQFGEFTEKLLQPGRWCQDELATVDAARAELAAARKLVEAARVHLEDSHSGSSPDNYAQGESVHKLALALRACQPAPGDSQVTNFEQSNLITKKEELRLVTR